MQKLEKLLRTQFVYINYIVINVEYILNHNNIQHSESHILLNRSYINVIARLASDDTVINLYKLFNHKEDHSFYTLKNEVSNVLLSEKYKFANKKSESIYNDFVAQFKEGVKLYKEMKINNLRNKYVAHLDYNRIPISFELEKLNKLKLILENIYSQLLKAFFNEVNYLNKYRNELNDVLKDNIKLKQFIAE